MNEIFITNDTVTDIAKSMNMYQKDFLILMSNMSDGVIILTSRQSQKNKMALSLCRLNIVESVHSFANKTSTYTINDLGWAVYHYLTNGTLPDAQPAADDMPVEMEEATLGDELFKDESAAITEPTGPALTPSQQDALNTFDETFDYMEMTPMAEHEFKVGDKVNGPHGVATITQILRTAAMVRYEDGTCQAIAAMAKTLTPYIDPRDAEISALKSEIAALKETLKSIYHWGVTGSYGLLTVQDLVARTLGLPRLVSDYDEEEIEYPEDDELPFEEENQNYNADLGLGDH